MCSREVAAFELAAELIEDLGDLSALKRLEPLKSRCSMKWEIPARASVSSREPAPIQ